MNMKLNRLVMLCAALVAGVILQSCCCSSPISGENYKFKNGMIVFDEPQRAAGQESMLAFAAEPIPVVRVGFIGLGMRGPGAVQRYTHIEGVEIKGLCDCAIVAPANETYKIQEFHLPIYHTLCLALENEFFGE